MKPIRPSIILPLLLALGTSLPAQNESAPALPAPGAVGPPPAVPGGPGAAPSGAVVPGAGAPGAAPAGRPGKSSASAGPPPTAEQILARDTEIEVIKAHLQKVEAEILELQQAPPASGLEQEKRTAKITALKAFGARLQNNLSRLEHSPLKAPGSAANGKTGLNQGHRPLQAVGAPDASEATFEGMLLAWHAQPSDSGKEWLGLIYERPVEVAEIRIHNINTTGTLARITGCVRDGSGPGDTVLWEGREQEEKTPAVRVITVAAGHVANGLRLEFDTTRSKKWQQIDAVELIGRDGSRQWAKTSEASSYYPVSAEPGKATKATN